MYQNSDKQIIYDFFNLRGFLILISSRGRVVRRDKNEKPPLFEKIMNNL
jgi:hypothetical protein